LISAGFAVPGVETGMKAVYGGAFNPPHTGHLKVAQQALETVDQLILVPSFAHPDGKVMAPWSIRLELTQALAEDINRPGRVFVSKVEEQMVERPCYTYLVLRILAREHGPVRFVVGEDNRLNSWEGGAEIQKDHTPLVVSRPPGSLSSTMVREQLRSGLSVEDLVSPRVLAVLKRYPNLYL
jgi:nicotinate-nucleotide adenylyltransferase